MNEIRLIVFDWDGTLSDSADRIVDAVSAAAVEAALPVRDAQQIRDVIGLGLVESFTTLYSADCMDQYETFANAYRDAYLNSNENTAKLFPGAVDTLRDLSRDYTLAVATGKSRVGLDREMKETATERFFATTRCADETVPKPNPKMLFEILQQTGIAAKHAIMIGDTDHDIKLAHNAGVVALAVQWGAQLRRRLEAAEPLEIFDRIDELPNWVRGR